MSETKDMGLIKASLQKKTTEKRRAKIHFSGEENDYLGHGAYSLVTRVSVPIRSDKYLDLAYKETSEGHAAHALRAWLRLKKADLPIPQTFRLVEHDGVYTGILMTDLTNGWKDVFITSNPTKGMIIDKVNVVNPSTIDGLAALDLQNPEFIDNLDEQITSIASKAAKGKIRFEHTDAISAVYQHTGELKLIISDMDNVQVDRAEPYEVLFANNRSKGLGIRLPISEAHRIAKELSG